MANHPNPKISDPRHDLVEYSASKLQWTGEVRCLPEQLEVPLRWRKPRRIFVCSQADLFHPDVPDEFIAAVFGVMAATPHHTYQLLTKRPDRLPRWFAWLEEMVNRAKVIFSEDPPSWRRAHILRSAGLLRGVQARVPTGELEELGWPLPNVWLGVSCEDQRTADERIPELLATPATLRFASCEPLLGPVNLSEWLTCKPDCGDPYHAHGACGRPGLDWAIVGGESGPGARPLHPQWARSIRDQCQAARVAYFFKQWGEWVAFHQMPDSTRPLSAQEIAHLRGPDIVQGEDPCPQYRVGKKRAGRLLDGREWNEMPEVHR